MDTTHIFAQRIKGLREERGLSQGKLADEIGISRGALSYYESAQRTADISMLVKFASYFDVTTDYLIGLSDNRTPEAMDIGKITGLSDEAIEKLSGYMRHGFNDEISAINIMLKCTPYPLDIFAEIAKYLFVDLSLYKDGILQIQTPLYNKENEIVGFKDAQNDFWLFTEDIPEIQLLKIQKCLITIREKFKTERRGAPHADDPETR